MIILGLSFDYHDSAAALIEDGKVIFAIQEERLTRIKNDKRFPIRAIEECLRFRNININELDYITYYENALKKFDRIAFHNFFKKFNFKIISDILKDWIDEDKFFPSDKISKTLEFPKSKIFNVDHHQSHRDSAIFCSGFKESLVITIDGVGEYKTFSVSLFKDGEFKTLGSSNFPNSLGLFYSVITAFLGFQINEGEYKVMGMSAYGKPLYLDFFRKIIYVKNGKIILNSKYFNFTDFEKAPFNNNLIEVIGEPNLSKKTISDDNLDSKQELHYANIAASAQKVTEEIIISLVDYWKNKTKVNNLCLAGGCALNSLANNKIQKELKMNLFVQPAAGDAGCALGSALGFYYKKSKKNKISNFTCSLGSLFDKNDILKALSNYSPRDYKFVEKKSNLIKMTSKILAEGKIVGWFQGRSEWGPRALGNRSILASPKFKDMKNRLNSSIKFRESFRPFAPAIKSENASEYFEIEENSNENNPEKFMLTICKVKKNTKEKLPAIVHVDGSARVQTVCENENKIFYNLLNQVGKDTGHPVLINTSFNLKGEPIVNSPTDALKTFELSNIDYLVIENFLIKRPNYKNLNKI